MIENRTAGHKRKKRRQSLLSSDGPFPVDHNILQFFAGGGRGELLSSLVQHLQNRDDPAVVFGEAGSGKTFLSRVLADRLQHKFDVVRYDLPTVSADDILKHLWRHLTRGRKNSLQASFLDGTLDSIECEDADTFRLDSIDIFNDRTLDLSAEPANTPSVAELVELISKNGAKVQPVLLILDTSAEFDSGSVELLEQLNQTKKSGIPLFSAVIFQSISPDAYVAQAAEWSKTVEPSSQVTSRYLKRLNLAEIHEYLEHHMMLFDYSQRHAFSREMSYFIADRSEGIFGRINDIARSAFMLAGINSSSKVSLSHLVAISSSQHSRHQSRSKSRDRKVTVSKIAMLATGTLVLGAIALLMAVN